MALLNVLKPVGNFTYQQV